MQTGDTKNAVLPRAGVSRKLTRAKLGRQFFITIGFEFSLLLSERLNVLQNLESFDRSNEIITYCIAQENSFKSEKFIHHIHCFVEYNKPILVIELCEYLGN